MSISDSDSIFSYRKENIVQCRDQNMKTVASISSRSDSASFQRNKYLAMPSRTYIRPILSSHSRISPFSVNPFDSNTTMISVNIVKAIKNMTIPRNDVLLIYNACRDRLKTDKRIVMKTKRYVYLRRGSYGTDDDSENQGSSASLRASNKLIPLRFRGRSYSHSVSGREKKSYLIETLRDSTLCKDCTENLTHFFFFKYVNDYIQISNDNEKNALAKAFASELVYNSRNKRNAILDINELDKNDTNWDAKFKSLSTSNSDEFLVPNPNLIDMKGLQRPINQISQESSNLGFLKGRFKKGLIYLSQSCKKTINPSRKIASSIDLSKSAQSISQISSQIILCQDTELFKLSDNNNNVVTNNKDIVQSDLLECSASSRQVQFGSPQKHIMSKDKNKTRKIVTRQSCLSNDVTQEDNCFLIVNPETSSVAGISINEEVKNKLTDLAMEKNLKENQVVLQNSNNTNTTGATSKNTKNIKSSKEYVNKRTTKKVIFKNKQEDKFEHVDLTIGTGGSVDEMGSVLGDLTKFRRSTRKTPVPLLKSQLSEINNTQGKKRTAQNLGNNKKKETLKSADADGNNSDSLHLSLKSGKKYFK